jgi:excisionase family DNA binding protein
MYETLTVKPDEIARRPIEEWPPALINYIRTAAEAGEVLTLSAHLETMSPADVADRIGVSRPTIARRIASGEIKAIRVGNRNRIPVAEFERFRASYVQELAADLSNDF